MLQALRAEMRSPAGRAALRERTHVEHRLARLDQIEGRKARYTGTRKNTLDVQKRRGRQPPGVPETGNRGVIRCSAL